jgi:hypothetical protein
LIVRQGSTGPVLHVFVEGKEVANIELNSREALLLIGKLADKMFETV